MLSCSHGIWEAFPPRSTTVPKIVVNGCEAEDWAVWAKLKTALQGARMHGSEKSLT